mmetsp:Transcript_6318/g.5729  ORF Transcript_6318/g.5729 Transcript_6318/m.5729 type:complete len:203 (+) Transcript_6318:568-1176(+)
MKKKDLPYDWGKKIQAMPYLQRFSFETDMMETNECLVPITETFNHPQLRSIRANFEGRLDNDEFKMITQRLKQQSPLQEIYLKFKMQSNASEGFIDFCSSLAQMNYLQRINLDCSMKPKYFEEILKQFKRQYYYLFFSQVELEKNTIQDFYDGLQILPNLAQYFGFGFDIHYNVTDEQYTDIFNRLATLQTRFVCLDLEIKK